jgi:hypothetical protein
MPETKQRQHLLAVISWSTNTTTRRQVFSSFTINDFRLQHSGTGRVLTAKPTGGGTKNIKLHATRTPTRDERKNRSNLSPFKTFDGHK